MKKITLVLLSFLFCGFCIAQNAPTGYVDLGLSSGTLWKTSNENVVLSYGSAVNSFGSSLPTMEQWMELRNECQWTWSGMGYVIKGPNGEILRLPAASTKDCDGVTYDFGVGEMGNYWSSTRVNRDDAWSLDFTAEKISIEATLKCHRYSIRLVSTK